LGHETVARNPERVASRFAILSAERLMVGAGGVGVRDDRPKCFGRRVLSVWTSCCTASTWFPDPAQDPDHLLGHDRRHAADGGEPLAGRAARASWRRMRVVSSTTTRRARAAGAARALKRVE